MSVRAVAQIVISGGRFSVLEGMAGCLITAEVVVEIVEGDGGGMGVVDDEDDVDG